LTNERFLDETKNTLLNKMSYLHNITKVRLDMEALREVKEESTKRFSSEPEAKVEQITAGVKRTFSSAQEDSV